MPAKTCLSANCQGHMILAGPEVASVANYERSKDAAWIDIALDSSVCFWSVHFETSPTRLREIVATVGPSVYAVHRYFRELGGVRGGTHQPVNGGA